MDDQIPAQSAAPSNGVYARLIGRIQEIEKTATRPENAYVNITSVFSTAQKEKPRTFSELLKAIDGIEAKKTAAKEVTKDKGPVTPVPVSARVQPSEEKLPKKESAGIAEYPGLEAAMSKQENTDESKGLSRLSRIRSMGQPKMHIDTEKLVLPGLQMQDQVTELDNIIAGLKQGAFDKDHIQIVIQEIYGLKQVADEQKKEQKKQAKKLTASDQTLWNMRDKKIAEAIIQLQKGGK